MSKLLAYLPKLPGASPISFSEMLLYFEKLPVPVVRVQPIAGMVLRSPEGSQMGEDPARIWFLPGGNSVQTVSSCGVKELNGRAQSSQAQVSIDVAVGEEVLAARTFIASSYLRDLGHAPQDDLDSAAQFLVATADSAGLVGVMRYLSPRCWPFGLDGFPELAAVLPRFNRAALIGRLCVDPAHRRITRTHNVQLELLRGACQLAGSDAATDLLLFTFPRLARLYQRILFEPVGATFFHAEAATEMMLMRLNLGALSGKMGRTARFLSGIAR